MAGRRWRHHETLLVGLLLACFLADTASFRPWRSRAAAAPPSTSFRSPRSFSPALHAAKKNKGPVGPEFSRVLNVGQIPGRRPVLCKLLAKESERAGLAERFDIPELTYFAANVTVSRRDAGSLVVTGDIEAHIKGGELMEPEVIESDFETLLLDNTVRPTRWRRRRRCYPLLCLTPFCLFQGSVSGVSFEEAMDYDDEVGQVTHTHTHTLRAPGDPSLPAAPSAPDRPPLSLAHGTGQDGNIDLGEIAAQYLSLELF